MPMDVPVIHERHVKLFRNGRNQAVRIPREFELPGEDAIMRKEGDRLIIEPTLPRSLLALLTTLSPIEEDFPPIPELASTPSSCDALSTRHRAYLSGLFHRAGFRIPD
jgi:antitoxin VapB